MRPRLAFERSGRHWFAHGGRCRPVIRAANYRWMFLAARCVCERRVRFASREIARVEKRGF
eukprot:778989-Pleurochrysis_carterae.AAC.1